MAGAGRTWHQWADTGVFALHVPSRPGLLAPSKGGAHAHFPLSHRSEARMPPQLAHVWPFHKWPREMLNALEGDAPPVLGQLAVRLLLYANDLALMSHNPTRL